MSRPEDLASRFSRTLTFHDRDQNAGFNFTKRQAEMRKFFINEEEFLDPKYDCDLTNLSDFSRCERGREMYQRPNGWYRIALKVKGKYPDGDAWLGLDGWSSRSVHGEWPVSYHGTSLRRARRIIRSYYKAGDREKYGRGIYSTPDVVLAAHEEYARTFRCETTSRKYKVILQNRINPDMREICNRNHWLIPVPEGTSPEWEKRIAEASIRPYGILIKEV